MNAARLNKSKRLDRVYNLLLSKKEYTTRQIMSHAKVCAVNSCIAELRENGCNITCQQRGKRWYYKLIA